MDAHHDIVMNARKAAGEGTRLYFAYSTILDRPAFLEWRGQHGYDFFDLPAGALGEAKGQTLVFDFPSRWWGGRVAGLKAQAGTSVWGRVFEISEKDWPIIQHKEGAVTGMCVEQAVKVLVDGKEVDAFAFTTNPVRASSDGPVSPRFVQALTSGAVAAQLPASWLGEIEALAKAG